jgi:FKBP-type peptidyl-prolyl cis-trans isomerase SlpA
VSEITVGQGTKVTMHFSLSLTDGTEVDSNFDATPATFEVGDGSLLTGYEEALFGLKAGDEQVFEMQPEQGFGQHNPSNVQRLSRKDFDPAIELEPGLVLSFADANRGELPGVIMTVEDDEVTVDFNHPLAGRTILFRVAILQVEPAVKH